MLTVQEIFKAINNIPRPSHHEEKIADYLCAFAKERNLSYSRDTNNCVVIRKPATPGHENATLQVLNPTDRDITAKVRNMTTGEIFPVTVPAGDFVTREL